MRMSLIDMIIDDIDNTTWYHINRNGELVEGARGDEDALYKAKDIWTVLKKHKAKKEDA